MKPAPTAAHPSPMQQRKSHSSHSTHSRTKKQLVCHTIQVTYPSKTCLSQACKIMSSLCMSNHYPRHWYAKACGHTTTGQLPAANWPEPGFHPHQVPTFYQHLQQQRLGKRLTTSWHQYTQKNLTLRPTCNFWVFVSYLPITARISLSTML
jgi:hypothetical protein